MIPPYNRVIITFDQRRAFHAVEFFDPQVSRRSPHEERRGKFGNSWDGTMIEGIIRA